MSSGDGDGMGMGGRTWSSSIHSMRAMDLGCSALYLHISRKLFFVCLYITS